MIKDLEELSWLRLKLNNNKWKIISSNPEII